MVIELCAPLGDHQGLAMAHRFLGEVALGGVDLAAADAAFRARTGGGVAAGERGPAGAGL